MALGKVNGVYRLSKDVELRYLASGSALAKISLVNSAKYKTQSGEQKEESCFIDGTVFGKLAEVANQYLRKGSKVWIDKKKEQQKPKPQPGQMSPQQIKNLLEAMNNQEQKVQEKMNAVKEKGVKIKTEKDW